MISLRILPKDFQKDLKDFFGPHWFFWYPKFSNKLSKHMINFYQDSYLQAALNILRNKLMNFLGGNYRSLVEIDNNFTRNSSKTLPDVH